MPSAKDLAAMGMAESLVRNGDPDRAERAMRSIQDEDFREHGLTCLVRDIATASVRVDDRRYAKRLLKMARRIAESIDTPWRREEAMAHVDTANEVR